MASDSPETNRWEQLINTEIRWRPHPDSSGTFVTEDEYRNALSLKLNKEEPRWTLSDFEKTYHLEYFPRSWRLAFNSVDEVEPLSLTAEDTKIYFPCTVETTKAFIESIIDQLNSRCLLAFHDLTYPSPTDPGAGCDVWLKDGALWIRRANYGWSEKAEEIAKTELVELIEKNKTNRDFQLRLESRHAVSWAEIPDEKHRCPRRFFLYYPIEDIVDWSEGKRSRLIRTP